MRLGAVWRRGGLTKSSAWSALEGQSSPWRRPRGQSSACSGREGRAHLAELEDAVEARIVVKVGKASVGPRRRHRRHFLVRPQPAEAADADAAQAHVLRRDVVQAARPLERVPPQLRAVKRMRLSLTEGRRRLRRQAWLESVPLGVSLSWVQGGPSKGGGSGERGTCGAARHLRAPRRRVELEGPREVEATDTVARHAQRVDAAHLEPRGQRDTGAQPLSCVVQRGVADSRHVVGHVRRKPEAPALSLCRPVSLVDGSSSACQQGLSLRRWRRLRLAASPICCARSRSTDHLARLSADGRRWRSNTCGGRDSCGCDGSWVCDSSAIASSDTCGSLIDRAVAGFHAAAAALAAAALAAAAASRACCSELLLRSDGSALPPPPAPPPPAAPSPDGASRAAADEVDGGSSSASVPPPPQPPTPHLRPDVVAPAPSAKPSSYPDRELRRAVASLSVAVHASGLVSRKYT